ncbi:prephenate/arogenate dehydrogenase [Synechococcus sp. Cruz-9H2]|uniref:prephenate/arogenate dehydrogenase n=1 Tax=unclassified Synechococcus TaxID=2626047 RepID=UPI0020CE5B22|nr:MULTISPECIES: prephenate/arogenate dehydrogenase [unclassified Synechococcus]MCP9819011.1 prephenate/arogenate dehydrogenase [Synechococcus sp. Cruz-9H2]MCP9843515.1 prephenate/arogenate dehydrogenase [Synechococcus sp. Edmonson 11F2]MCP9855103.1 prephenate/arogenate dehydrogenase [Synechococcus sp. Cruz-9C9]MCP9862925.1 prephenate/arogenate dehydrogenase [Synechococcus sp. Cruz-7E5]MCP9869921.1 prephenate/arogenate dehydrogenase [Synechococcus sp. Cruz-7B9]
MTTLWHERPVGVVGLGLIGGSIGLDLMALGVEVRGLVHRPATAERARQRGLASQVSTDPAVLKGCAMVLLALPLDQLLEPSPDLLAALPKGAVIADLASVKAPVLAAWESLVPHFVATHPMAGTIAAGVEAGLPNLFRGRPWVATPTLQTDPAALEQVRAMAVALGAQWLVCDAQDHDRAVALISHLPVLVGAALLRAAEHGAEASSKAALPQLVRALASSGFADTTRVGGGNPELGTLMAQSNRAALAEALGYYRQALDGLEGLLEQHDWDGLGRELEACRDLRPEFL